MGVGVGRVCLGAAHERDMTSSTRTQPPLTATYRPGDVYSYEPADGRHCREGMALANTDGVLVDTFWMPSGSGVEHVLTFSEAQGVEFLFNVHEGWQALPRHLEYTWVDYAPEDRQVLTGQHGLRKTLYVRTGATPDLATKIANAEQRVADAKYKAESALRAVTWAEETLAALLAEQAERQVSES